MDADDECGCMSDGVVNNIDQKLTFGKWAVLKPQHNPDGPPLALGDTSLSTEVGKKFGGTGCWGSQALRAQQDSPCLESHPLPLFLSPSPVQIQIVNSKATQLSTRASQLLYLRVVL